MRDVMLIRHFIGLVMGLGTSFAHMFLVIAASKMQPEEAANFSIKAMALTRMGHIGITLLIVSGFYLMTPYWSLLPVMPLLITKLSLVLLLVIWIVIISIAGNKFKKGDASQLKIIKPTG